MIRAQKVDIASLIDERKVSWYQATIMFWTCVAMFLEGSDMQVISYAAPSIIKTWHVNKAYFGSVFGSGLFGYMLGATLLSDLGDRFGRKALIISGTLLFGVFTLATTHATSITDLLVLRFIAGVGLGVAMPTTIALGAEYAPARIRATTISVMCTSYIMGALISGLLAAELIPTYGWPIVFYIGGIAPVLLAVILTVTLPESVRFLTSSKSAAFQSKRVLRILAKLAPSETFDSSTQFLVRTETLEGLPVRQLFTEGRASMTSFLWLAISTSFLGHVFLTSWMPTVFESVGVSLKHAVMAGALFQGGGVVGSLLMGRLLDKRGIIAIAIAFAAATPLTLLMGPAIASVSLLLSLVFVTGMCMLGGHTGLNAASGIIYPTFIRSTGTGWALGVGRIGSILGPMLGGVLISFGPPTSLLFTFAAIPILCCSGAAYLLGRVPAAQQDQLGFVGERM